MPMSFAEPTEPAIPIRVTGSDTLADWLAGLPPQDRAWLQATGFAGKLGKVQPVPGPDGAIAWVAAGWGTAADRARGRLHFGAIAGALPAGSYRIADGLAPAELPGAALAFLLSGYRFDRYRKAQDAARASLAAPAGIDAARTLAIADGAALAMDLINTPASDLGPQELEDAVHSLAARFGATVEVTAGDALLEANLPMIHAVGRASPRAPRLIDLHWGDPDHPKVTLVGKGVCFDTGGLDLKPSSSMELMKKDMGGAANVLACAQMVMATGLPIRLRVLVPAVENSVSGAAFRPKDILASRKGLSVEINNTDAEGRLILADALALADEDAPTAIFCLATLTGAARVALGPDLPPFFTRDEALARDLSAAADAVADPVWRLPLWPPYEAMIEPGIADLDNAPKGGMAGAITAALFLQRFVTATPAFVHLDIFGWTPSALPGRPQGGACQAARAIFHLLAQRHGG
jgi:leucyl aminopeptidase